MAIPKSATFNYTATVEKWPSESGELVLKGPDIGKEKMWLGSEPIITFTGTHVSLSAASNHSAPIYVLTYPVGDVMLMLVKPGDRISLRRDSSAHFGVAVLRERKLVLAVGAVTALDLGTGFKARRGPCTDWWEERIEETWIEFEHLGFTVQIRDREFWQLGDYDVYVERSWWPGTDSRQEYAAVSQAGNEKIRLAAMRSAILLGNKAPTVIPWETSSG